MNAGFLKLIEFFCTDSLYLRNNNVRFHFLHYFLESITIQHTEHPTLICNLHSRSIIILVTSHYVLSLTLAGNHEFLSQFTGTQ